MLIDDAEIIARDPSTPAAIFKTAISLLAVELAQKSIAPHDLSGRLFHIIATASDFEAAAVPIAEHLSGRGAMTALTCAWTDIELVLREPIREIAPIRSLVKSKVNPGQTYELVLVSGVVGTIAELKSLVTHALYDQKGIDYKSITVLIPFAHKDAEREFRNCLPDGWSDVVSWRSRCTDPDLAPDGSLSPGIKGKMFRRLGFQRIEDTFARIPSVFLEGIPSTPIRNPGYNPGAQPRL